MEQRVYEKIFSSAGEGILVVQHGEWRLCNPALLDIFELKEGDRSFVSKNIHQFLHPEDLDLVLERHLSRLSGKTPPKNYEFRIVTRNRNIKWVALNVERFLWDEKPATLCFISDITKRVESENRLRDREERYRRQSEYLTALHETALRLMDRLRTEGLIHSITSSTWVTCT